MVEDSIKIVAQHDPQIARVLSLELKYAGEHFDPRDSDNELFNTILAEPTTTLVDEEIINSPKWYNNHTKISFRWED